LLLRTHRRADDGGVPDTGDRRWGRNRRRGRPAVPPRGPSLPDCRPSAWPSWHGLCHSHVPSCLLLVPVVEKAGAGGMERKPRAHDEPTTNMCHRRFLLFMVLLPMTCHAMLMMPATGWRGNAGATAGLGAIGLGPRRGLCVARSSCRVGGSKGGFSVTGAPALARLDLSANSVRIGIPTALNMLPALSSSTSPTRLHAPPRQPSFNSMTSRSSSSPSTSH
jgi:hypothetical protein